MPIILICARYDGIFEKNKEKISILQEFFGQCLTRDVKQEKGMLLLGESRSGKSTILNTLQNMVGKNNCSTLALKYIIHPVFTSQLVGKLINIDKDVSAKAVDFEEDFKKIEDFYRGVNAKYPEKFNLS